MHLKTMVTKIGIPNGKIKWFDEWSQSCDCFNESRQKVSTVD